ncbi:MAG: M20/M25/M40 family metallo-hydrolase, partial [Candidatus Syntrophosphaera sp.]
MKRILTLVMILQAMTFALAAHVSAIPAASLKNEYAAGDLNGRVRMLATDGYDILHYDSEYVIAITPAESRPLFPGEKMLSAYPPEEDIYLVGKIPIRGKPDLKDAGKILLELESAYLVESPLGDVQLRQLIDHPFTQLEMRGIRFPSQTTPPSVSQARRTDIDAMIALVSETSVENTIQSLEDFQTRYAMADNRLLVAQWIRQKFIDYGVTNTQLQTFQWNDTSQYNVVATIPGTIYPDQFIIVGGHHDSISNNSDPYVFAPGADDNASGAVAALEMARVMMQSGFQPRTSIRFVTFAAEEFGLWGSKHYAQYALDNGQNIRLMMNHDMIANNEADPANWEVRLMPYDGSLDHSAYAAQITEDYTDLSTYYGNSNSGSSDSYPFFQRGYNVIYFFESDFSDVYHSAQDLVLNLDPAYCAEVIRASVACAATFADMPAAPYGLVANDCGNGNSLQLSWEGYNDPNIDHYNVYYSTTLNDWGDPLETSSTSITIGDLTQGQLYYFGVSTVDTFDNESYMVYTTGVPLTIPLEPQNFTDQPVYQAISLSWEANNELDLAGYKLYRSQEQGVLGDQIGGTLQDTMYVDSDVTGSEDYYYYSLCAVDMDENASPFAQVVKSRPITLDHGVLIVDETSDFSGTSPFQPTDEQVDDFYHRISWHFDTAQLDLTGLDDNLRLADIGIYSSIIWHGNDFSSMDYPYGVRDALQDYVEAGGNAMFSLYMPTLAFALNSGYPETFAPDTFINETIGIAQTDYDNSARFRFATPVHDQFPQVEIDPQKTSPSLNGHILRVESIGPNPDCATVYNYGSDYEDTSPEGIMNDMPIGVLNLNNSGKVLTLAFPLYNLYEAQARDLVDYVFTEYFNESFSSTDDPSAPAVPAIRVSAGQPNPFRDETSFRIEVKDASLPLRVGIYN